jgi:hypothetical protein
VSDHADDDIFGKIDALLGKRAGFAGATRLRDDIDFPLLTEVVEVTDIDQPSPETHASVQAPQAWPAPAALAEAATVENAEPRPVPPEPNTARLLWGDAPVMPEVVDAAEAPAVSVAAPGEAPPMPQDTEMEAMLRRIIREELERILGRG